MPEQFNEMLDDDSISTEEDTPYQSEGIKTVFPLKKDEFAVYFLSMSVSDVMRRIKKEIIKLRPSYQRFYVWDDERASLLIDSIWNWVPIPQVFFLETKEWVLQVIDWQQRLTTLARFMTSDSDYDSSELLEKLLQYRTLESWFSPILKVKNSIFVEWEEQVILYNDLPANIKNKFENEPLSCCIIRPNYQVIQDEEKISQIEIEIFKRLNTGWIKLSFQEIRQSVYASDLMDFIKDESIKTSRQKYLPISTHIKYKEPSYPTQLLFRVISFFDAFSAPDITVDTIWWLQYATSDWDFEYKPPLTKFYDLYAKILVSFVPSQISERKNLINKTLDAIHKIWDQIGNDVNGRPLIFRYSTTWWRLTFNENLIDIISIW